jgi:transcriptional regulator with XRE-family HTH domain
MTQTFQDWLEEEMNRRGWTQAELARRSHISQPTLSRIVTETRQVGPDVALAIAHALGESPVKVYRMAGLLPRPTNARRAKVEELADLLYCLPPGAIGDEALESILAIARHAIDRSRTASAGSHPPLDRDAILAYFARRKGIDNYRPTAHDENKLDELERRGYSQDEILAAIDLAFDTRPPEASPIRMFAYCAAIALKQTSGKDKP